MIIVANSGICEFFDQISSTSGVYVEILALQSQGHAADPEIYKNVTQQKLAN